MAEYEYESEYESGEAYPEASPWESSEAWGEARRKPSPPPVRIPPRPSTLPSRPAGNFVTQAQLQLVNARIDSNTNAIKTVDSRVRGAISDLNRQGMALRKEITDRKKATDGMRREMQSTRELGAVVGLLAAQGGPLGSIAPLALLLPPDTLGLGGGSSSSDSSGSGGSILGGSSLLPIVVIAAATGAFGKIGKP